MKVDWFQYIPKHICKLLPGEISCPDESCRNLWTDFKTFPSRSTCSYLVISPVYQAIAMLFSLHVKAKWYHRSEYMHHVRKQSEPLNRRCEIFKLNFVTCRQRKIYPKMIVLNFIMYRSYINSILISALKFYLIRAKIMNKQLSLKYKYYFSIQYILPRTY